jgi:hypothetical protein
VDWVLLEGITYEEGYLNRFCIEKNKKINLIRLPNFSHMRSKKADA